MDLPPEIRQMIYTLCNNQAVDPAGKEWGSSWNKHNHGMVYQPPIFRTCKAIRSEGLLDYYKRQSFTFGVHYELDLWKILSWLEKIGDAARLHIRDMTITLVPSWFDFSSGKALLQIHQALSDAATVRYEGSGRLMLLVGDFFTIMVGRHMDPPKRPCLQRSIPGRAALTFHSGDGWFGPFCTARVLRTMSKL